MVKVETIVIRERVEIVIDAVEHATGHVGVTVIEAIGHGRQRGVTHEYRGRVFESRFLPKALLIFVIEDRLVELVVDAIVDAARSGNESGDGLVWTSEIDNVVHNRTGTEARGGGGRCLRTTTLLIAASTIWVIVTAVLVMFMQAGFAFLEAGLTRMKNAGHIAGKNVLIFGICSLVYWAVGFGLAFGDGNAIVGTAGFFPSVNEMIAVGQKPYDWFSEIPGAAGYMFEVVFAGVSLAIVWGAMAERAKLWVYFVFGVWFTLTYSVVSHWIWSPHGWLFKQGMQDFAGSTVVHYQGALAGLAGSVDPRSADREVRHRREGEPDPGSQHPLRGAGHADPVVRLVRLQPRLDVVGRLRRLRLLRLRRADDQHRSRRRRSHRHVRGLGQAREA